MRPSPSPGRTLDLDTGSLAVRGSYTGPTKSGKARELTLPASEVAALRRYRKEQAERLLRIGVRQDEGSHVVADPYGRQMRPQALSAAFGRFARASGIGLDRFHGLRHTAAVLMLLSGVDVKTAASRLGHANPALLITTYSHFVRSADRAAAERLESLLG